MFFSTDTTRRNFLFNTTVTVGAASAARPTQALDALFSMFQIANMDDASVCRIVPSQLYVPLSPEDLTEARGELAKINPSDVRRYS